MIDFTSLYRPLDEEYLPFQKAGITELAIRPHVLLADEMGLGKTIQVIGYLNYARPARVLIICPNNLRLNWLNEINKWMDPSLRETYEIEYCTPPLYIPGASLVLASFEGLTKWSLTLRSERWDVLVVDEAHGFKNPSAKRSRALYEFGDKVPKRILLTGTPICNYPFEIFPLIHFLDPRQWPSVSGFNRRYCPYGNKYGYHLPELQDLLRNGEHFHEVQTIKKRRALRVAATDHEGYTCETCGPVNHGAAGAENHVVETGHTVTTSHETVTKIVPGEEVEIREVIDTRGVGLMIRRLKKEVLPELPRKRRQIIELPAEGQLLELVEEENKLWQTQAQIIKDLEEALTGLKQEAVDDDDFGKIIDNLKFNKRYFFDEIAIIRHKLALAKVPYVCDHIEDLLENKDKLVCFVHHNDVGRAIFERFADKAVHVYGATSMEDRAAAIEKFWNDDKCELFIGSLKVTGLGINLQVASNIVFAELDWVPGVITQAEDRCHRIGQEKSLLVQHLVAQNSMDSNMAKRIVTKQKSIQKALNRVEEPKT